MSHHLLMLHPTDVLFFRDGRPMEGSSAGHGAAWPLPHVLDAALHHALRRAQFEDFTPHPHTVKRSGRQLNADLANHGRHFGSLKSAGPFPIHQTHGWFFPRPADAAASGDSRATHLPLAPGQMPPGAASSLHPKLRPVISSRPPCKDKPEPWLSQSAWEAYLHGRSPDSAGTASGIDSPQGKKAKKSTGPEKGEPMKHFLGDHEIFSAQHTIGIGMDTDTGTQDGERFYSASYLRVREDISLGVIATCMDKGENGFTADTDLLEKTFLNSGHENRILAGGQQRVCTVRRDKAQVLPLPSGKTDGFHHRNGKWLVKWVLLTPAVFPHLDANSEKGVPEHQGGWLPSWIHPESFRVCLKNPAAVRPARRRGEMRADYRRRLHASLEAGIDAELVAALTGKPVPLTGWALTGTDEENGTLINNGGARATHLAVPAGSVYYFTCGSAEAAAALADALNWHGPDIPHDEDGTDEPRAGSRNDGASRSPHLHPNGARQKSVIRNRRSTLFGEKGFGLGVCGTWHFHPDVPPKTEP